LKDDVKSEFSYFSTGAVQRTRKDHGFVQFWNAFESVDEWPKLSVIDDTDVRRMLQLYVRMDRFLKVPEGTLSKTAKLT